MVVAVAALVPAGLFAGVAMAAPWAGQPVAGEPVEVPQSVHVTVVPEIDEEPVTTTTVAPTTTTAMPTTTTTAAPPPSPPTTTIPPAMTVTAPAPPPPPPPVDMEAVRQGRCERAIAASGLSPAPGFSIGCGSLWNTNLDGRTDYTCTDALVFSTCTGSIWIHPDDASSDAHWTRVVRHEIGHSWCIRTLGNFSELCAIGYE